MLPGHRKGIGGSLYRLDELIVLIHRPGSLARLGKLAPEFSYLLTDTAGNRVFDLAIRCGLIEHYRNVACVETSCTALLDVGCHVDIFIDPGRSLDIARNVA